MRLISFKKFVYFGRLVLDCISPKHVILVSTVVAGSLGTSVFDMKAFLVGASGGVYALLSAHLANILLVSFFSVNTHGRYCLN